MKPDFERCKELATITLLMADDVVAFPFDPREIRYAHDIMFISMQHYCRSVGVPLSSIMPGGFFKDGFNVIHAADQALIFYNEEVDSPGRFNWTLGHELGHVLLEHKQDGDIEEVEAHFFAANFYMPDDIICELAARGTPITQAALMNIFGVSSYAAAKKMNYLRRTRRNLGPSEYSSHMIEKFHDFIRYNTPFQYDIDLKFVLDF
ncbi:ImmA/IrrE family metallo-endopeptidase [Paenibacillus sp. HJGM_3]|uniref:ImmA/IrrE family metallo-endopeptidase n=1 Tax=Paenibacillus sp. HJGM_3 TaxID=3379816 RepID=UPI00385AA8E2